MIETTGFETLGAIGMTPALWHEHLHLLTDTAPAPQATALMRVTEVHRAGVLLHDGQAVHDARARPALLSQLAAAGDALAVGDWVHAARNALGEWWAHERLPPASQLARRLHDGRDKVERVVIVANVDTALLVMGLDGDYNLRRLERYVALVRMAGVAPLVVLTKADLAGDAADKLLAVQRLLPPGVPALAVDARAAGGAAAALAPWLARGRTLVLLGSSGAGKSTLTNALVGAGLQATGPNRAGDGRGRHTTTTRSLHRLPGGACIIDTPGLRTLRLDGDAERIGGAFDDIAALAPACRFRDCRHEAEPGCAVRDAVPAQRLNNFHKLLREARRDSLTALERKAQVQQWKARGRAGRQRAEAKRG